MGTHGATGSEVAMRRPFSRTFKWFLLWIGIETIGRYIDPNELINQRPILAIEKTYVPGNLVCSLSESLNLAIQVIDHGQMKILLITCTTTLLQTIM